MIFQKLGLPALAFIFATAPASAVAANGGAISSRREMSHCSSNEFVYFSCVLKNTATIVSLCLAAGQDDKSAGDSHVEFRSGPGRSIDFRFPSDVHEKAKDNFKGESLKPYGENISVDTITFDFDGVSYGISKSSGKWNISKFWKYENGLATDTSCATPLADRSMRSLIYDLPPLDED